MRLPLSYHMTSKVIINNMKIPLCYDTSYYDTIMYHVIFKILHCIMIQLIYVSHDIIFIIIHNMMH